MPAIPIIHRPLPRRAAALALAVALAALVFGATAAQAPARGRSAGCPHPAGGHRHHGTCARSRHGSKKGRAGHHAKRAVHPAGRHRVAGARVKPRVVAGATITATSQVPASCEDGSAPVRVEDEVFECEDASEPHCEAGSSFALSSDGSSLLCSRDSVDGPGSGEAECADGSSPGPSHTCESAGGEAGCEASPSADGEGDPTLVCDPAAGEASDASSVSIQASAGSSSQEASGS